VYRSRISLVKQEIILQQILRENDALILRKCTDSERAAALQFIRANAHRLLQVEDLSAIASMSAPWMERPFRTLPGRSVSAEIRRAHIDRAKQLLLESDFSMYRIAAASSFSNTARLRIVFRKAVGISPS
jgi:LacI family transcriptional regulator